jgi:hypothetical protein
MKKILFYSFVTLVVLMLIIIFMNEFFPKS